jgi:hypothetical protein
MLPCLLGKEPMCMQIDLYSNCSVIYKFCC